MACDTIRLRVDGDAAIALRLDEDVGVGFAHDEYIRYLTSDMPDYEGAYSVTPRFSSQTLATTNRVMRDDVTVHAINYTEAPNDCGVTVTIGG